MCLADTEGKKCQLIVSFIHRLSKFASNLLYKQTRESTEGKSCRPQI